MPGFKGLGCRTAGHWEFEQRLRDTALAEEAVLQRDCAAREEAREKLVSSERLPEASFSQRLKVGVEKALRESMRHWDRHNAFPRRALLNAQNARGAMHSSWGMVCGKVVGAMKMEACGKLFPTD